MISIIISTYRPNLLSYISKNIEATIGVPFEIISIENKGEMGICTAYNKGASQAKFDLLCFVHEDVEFVTGNWGQPLEKLFEKDRDLALAGVAGCKYKSQYVTGWTSGQRALDMMNVSHRTTTNPLEKSCFNPANETVSDAVVLDGVCLFMRKNAWEETPFDERIKGFHFYDVDISLQISSKKKKVAVIFFIELIHFSQGKFNNAWLTSAFKYHRSKEKLEIIKRLQSQEIHKKYDRQIRQFWLNRLTNEEISYVNRFKLVLGNYGLYKEVLIIMLKKIKNKLYRTGNTWT